MADQGKKAPPLWQRVSQHVNLVNIRTVALNASASIECPHEAPKEHDFVLAHRAVALSKSTDGQFCVEATAILRLGPPAEDRDNDIRIEVVLALTYEIDEGITFTEEERGAFAELNGLHNAWPYLRETIDSLMRRLGMPPYQLPLLKLPKPEKSGSKKLMSSQQAAQVSEKETVP